MAIGAILINSKLFLNFKKVNIILGLESEMNKSLTLLFLLKKVIKNLTSLIKGKFKYRKT